ncbi:MAG: hypothetical protein IPK85_16265 [Gemmatimonadetes bacterium]|nr:hypothetical protein [Gemmatimonadota bacterium]
MSATRLTGMFLAALALSSAPVEAQRGRLRVALPAFGAQVVLDTIGDVQVVKAPPGKVFTAATMVMQNLMIPIDVSDSATGMLGAAKLVRSRNLAGQALSRFLECGSNMTGPRADTHRVQMPLLLLMDPGDEGSTRLRIALVGSAQDNSGTSNSPVMCGSTGGLENLLRTAIGKQLLELP